VCAREQSCRLLLRGGREGGTDLILDLKQRAFMSCNDMVVIEDNSDIPQDKCNH